jgi:hypothetical protein
MRINIIYVGPQINTKGTKMRTQIASKNSLRNGENDQPLASISANTIFLACNFENRRVKRHFDGLKKKWERTLPVRVYLSDQVKGGGARDLWKDITQNIIEANLAIFDVTSFRPNVVLELGFALAYKQASRIIICRDLTPSGKKSVKQEKWQLSDIAHLYHIEYSKFNSLDKKLLQHVDRMTTVRNFYDLSEQIKRQYPKSYSFYTAVALDVLKKLRDSRQIRGREFRSLLNKFGVDAKELEILLRRFKLAKPESGSNGFWKLID